MSPHLLKLKKKSFVTLLICFPTSLLAFLLLSSNGASIFCLKVPFPPKTTPDSYIFPTNKEHSSSSSIMYSLKEEPPLQKTTTTNLPPLHETEHLTLSTPKWSRKKKPPQFRLLQSTELSKRFSVRAKEFFKGHGNVNGTSSSCKVRFFITWISNLESFGDRELFTIESVFKSHPNACLLIISSSLDSKKGGQLLRPFVDKGFRVLAVSPDFDYLFKNTFAEGWFGRLSKGEVDPGEVSLGQNLSNLLRLAVLYKFGGVYLDTDFIVLKRVTKLRNVIGAQTIDLETGNWSRLNNAVMIFDKKHPLLYKFMEEFALTFNGNKWGHNGPYLVSRVVTRVSENPGLKFTVLPPMAFYPVDWSRIQGLFHGPRGRVHAKWMSSKLRQIRKESFGVHLWNKHSRALKIEEGSIISQLMLDSCVFCSSSVSAL